MRRCDACRFWSDQVARADAAGLRAMCLSPASLNRGCYTRPTSTCAGWQRGEPIDTPRRGTAA